VLTFEDSGCHVVSVTDPSGRFLGFLDRSRYSFFQVAHSCTQEAEWTPFQTVYFSENLVAPGIEPGPVDLWPGTLTTRPQRRSIEVNPPLPNSQRLISPRPTTQSSLSDLRDVISCAAYHRAGVRIFVLYSLSMRCVYGCGGR
jgi:hypothetical protein